VNKKLNYAPSSDSLLYYFISIVIKFDKIIERRINITKLEAILVSSGPYEADYYNSIISPLFDKIENIYNVSEYSRNDEDKKKKIKELQEYKNLI